MKTKIITALIAFAATFGTSAALTGALFGKQTPSIAYTIRSSNPQAQQKILTLLRQDISNGEERFGKISDADNLAETISAARLIRYSKAVSEYYLKSASMDDTALPPDFQLAWRQHMKAWDDHAIFVNQLAKSAQAGQITDEEIAEELYDREDNAINRTWYKALRIAGRYDANPYDNY